ncbi:MAG: hypothetical protein M3Q49_10265 [Actinomycetota bacterium]|nr:hypothetical protein [Actinomycetota bacterium]
MNPHPQTVRKIGLSYVRNQLSRRGWKVVSPARSTRGVDFFAHPQDGLRKLTIKVRALSRRKAVSLGPTLDNLLADYVVVCRKLIEPNPECFILTTEEVRELANPNEKDGEVSYWLEPRDYETEQFQERWDRMGSGVD